VWRQREKFHLPCLFFVNKMDRPGADFDQVMQSIHKRLGGTPVAITIPIPEQEAVVNLIDRTLIRFAGEHGEQVITGPCDDATWNRFAEQRENLLLGIAETDDRLADQVLAGDEPDSETLWISLRSATLNGDIHPCFGGSALRNLGVQPLIDAVVKLLPSPLDRPDAIAFLDDGSKESVAMEDSGSLAALAFKVQMWEGRRHVFARLYRGVLRPGDNVSYKKPDGRMANEHVARIFDVDAAKKSRLNMAHAGEIVLLAGLRHVATGDTLCEPDHPLLLERIDTREPVLSLAIEPGSSDQEEKFLEVMEKLQEEDPTLRFGEDADTGQRLLSGMGELHLQIIIERLEREYNLLVKAGKPAVALRETVTKSSRIDHLFQPPAERANGDLELKARVVLSISPRERGSGVQTSIEPLVLPEGSHLNPAQRESLEQGLLFSLGGGPLEGAPLQDLQVDIEEVEIFGSSSTPAALSATVSRAVAKALHNAKPALLQPIMSAEVVVPEANLGSVLGDLQSRHAIIRDTQHNKEDASISCEVALAELLGYTTQLRSMTQGRGQFSTIFKRFDTA